MIVLGIILGIVIALCFSFMVTMLIVRKSNDMGDSKGTFREFSDSPLRIISKKDGVNANRWER